MSTANSTLCNGNGKEVVSDFLARANVAGIRKILATCECYECYSGYRCKSLVCQNGGQHSEILHLPDGSSIDVQTCECVDGYLGTCCQTPGINCRGGGTFVKGKCKCPYPKNQLEPDCAIARCPHGQPDGKGYCTCNLGHRGRFCEEHTCLNGGRPRDCTTFPNGHVTACKHCSCPEYTMGDHCEYKTCRNGGYLNETLRGRIPNRVHQIAVSEDLKMVCVCPSFYRGKYCEKLRVDAVVGNVFLGIIVSILIALIAYACVKHRRAQRAARRNHTNRATPAQVIYSVPQQQSSHPPINLMITNPGANPPISHQNSESSGSIVINVNNTTFNAANNIQLAPGGSNRHVPPMVADEEAPPPSYDELFGPPASTTSSAGDQNSRPDVPTSQSAEDETVM